MRSVAALTVVALLAASCGGSSRPAASTTSGVSGGTAVSAPDIVIDAAADRTPFAARILGTNVPAWLGPELLGDADFQAETRASGTTLLRMPGGSWSNSYEWDACETGDAERCFWPTAARPSDFIDFLNAVDVDGMWTLSINATAQSAAAAVSFFNGSVDDADGDRGRP